MNINIKATNIELTSEIRDYLNKRLSSLEKLLPTDKETNIFVELGKESNHHQNGDELFMAELRLSVEGRDLYVKDFGAELFAAIDLVKDEAQRQIKEKKEKSQTLFVRGARKLKKRIKGMKPWWPFGDKTEQK